MAPSLAADVPRSVGDVGDLSLAPAFPVRGNVLHLVSVASAAFATISGHATLKYLQSFFFLVQQYVSLITTLVHPKVVKTSHSQPECGN